MVRFIPPLLSSPPSPPSILKTNTHHPLPRNSAALNTYLNNINPSNLNGHFVKGSWNNPLYGNHAGKSGTCGVYVMENLEGKFII
jgi:hypothetical protein